MAWEATCEGINRKSSQWHVKTSDMLFSMHKWISRVQTNPETIDFQCEILEKTWSQSQSNITMKLNGLCSLSLILSHRLEVLHEHWTSMDKLVQWHKSQMQWAKNCMSATNSRNILTQWQDPDSRPKGTSSFFLLVSWQPEQKLWTIDSMQDSSFLCQTVLGFPLQSASNYYKKTNCSCSKTLGRYPLVHGNISQNTPYPPFSWALLTTWTPMGSQSHVSRSQVGRRFKSSNLRLSTETKDWSIDSF